MQPDDDPPQRLRALLHIQKSVPARGRVLNTGNAIG